MCVGKSPFHGAWEPVCSAAEVVGIATAANTTAAWIELAYSNSRCLHCLQGCAAKDARQLAPIACNTSATRCNRCTAKDEATQASCAMVCYEGLRFQVVMASVSDVLARYESDTSTWAGFAPDFLNLISNELGFKYDIVDERSLCDIIAVEYFRAYLRIGEDFCANVTGTMGECCAVAANEYAPNDLGAFNLGPDRALQIDLGKLIEGSDGSFRFVYKDGDKRGQLLSAYLLLNHDSGEHPRATPVITEILQGDIPRAWGDGLSTTPMYSEEVETLIFSTTEETMWNLFKPFTWQLWIAIISMVRTQHPYRSLLTAHYAAARDRRVHPHRRS